MFGRTKKEISIHAMLGEKVWHVEVDRAQMEQVLLNLYVNAWQAMPGGGDLYIQTQNVELDEDYTRPYDLAPGRYVKISTTDTGHGMDEETKKGCLSHFSQQGERAAAPGSAWHPPTALSKITAG